MFTVQAIVVTVINYNRNTFIVQAIALLYELIHHVMTQQIGAVTFVLMTFTRRKIKTVHAMPWQCMVKTMVSIQ